MTDTTVTKQYKPWQFKKGEPSANPAGRPKGSKNELSTAYINDIYEAWKLRGMQAIHDMIDEDPGGFVRAVASILPKEIVVNDKTMVIEAPPVASSTEDWVKLYAPQPKPIALPPAPKSGNGGTSH